MVEPLRHRQTKGAATDMPGLPPPRHISTPPWAGVAVDGGERPLSVHSGDLRQGAGQRARRAESGDLNSYCPGPVKGAIVAAKSSVNGGLGR
jgi:hypothetical protein